MPPLLGSHWAWKAALAGLAAIAMAGLIGLIVDSPTARPNAALDAIRVLIVFGGALAVGVSVSCLPRDPRMLAIAALSSLAGYSAFPPAWDSGRMVAIFATAFATIATILMWLPQNYRRLGVSLLVLLHFGGIVTAVTGPGAAPWLSSQLSTRVYRPYLQFIYMTNAYHFYSPEPGPAHIMWFCIYYENGDTRWVKMPSRPRDIQDPLSISYYRRLSLSEQLHALPMNRNPSDDVMRARLTRIQGVNGIPLHPEMPIIDQYRPLPENYREHLLPGFVRHVASHKYYQHDDPHVRIKSIKVYYVEHFILTPDKVQAGAGFYDDFTYLPFYFGEHGPDGELMNTNDPLLYWLMPIVYFPKQGVEIKPEETWKSHPQKFDLVDSVVRHSGSDHKAK